MVASAPIQLSAEKLAVEEHTTGAQSHAVVSAPIQSPSAEKLIDKYATLSQHYAEKGNAKLSGMIDHLLEKELVRILETTS